MSRSIAKHQVFEPVFLQTFRGPDPKTRGPEPTNSTFWQSGILQPLMGMRMWTDSEATLGMSSAHSKKLGSLARDEVNTLGVVAYGT